MKKLFLTLLIVNCSLLIDTASAQWWVQGGNLLWPYGAVTVNDSLFADKLASNTATIENLTVTGNLIASTETNDSLPSYTALLSADNNSIDSYVLENTLGFDISWSRNALGRYTGTFSETISDSKELFIIAPSTSKSSIDNNFYTIGFIISNSSIQIRQDQDDISSWLGAVMNYDGVLYYPIKILKYPQQ